MSTISPKQCKAARMLLGLSQEDLAKISSVGLTTLGSFESEGNKTKLPRISSIDQIRDALEKAGIDFLDGDGVKRRSDDIRTYKGPNGCNDFFAEMLRDIQDGGSDILVCVKSHDLLTRYSGDPCRNNLERLAQLHEITDVKCILTDTRSAPLPPLPFGIRLVPKMILSPSSFFIYGDKLAFMHMNICRELCITVLHEFSMAQDYRDAFMMCWTNTAPFQIQTARAERHLDFAAAV